jgi:hypothetical protein
VTVEPDDAPADKPKRSPAKKADYDLVQNAVKAGDVKLEITPREAPEERRRRLEEESRDAELTRWKEKAQFIFTLGLLALVVACCLMILASATRPESEKKWAMSALALIVGGAVTRTFGREK